MAVNSSIPAHTRAANDNPPSTSPASTTLTREHLQQHNQRQHQHQISVHPILTALPRFNSDNNPQGDHHVDTPTTATIDNALATAAAIKEIDLSEPGTAGTTTTQSTLISHDKHTSTGSIDATYPSHNPFDDPSHIEADGADKPVDPSSTPTHLKSQQQQQLQQQPWSNNRHPVGGKWISRYTRFFRLDIPATHSSQLVHSTWLPTGALLSIRTTLFLYTASVLLADIILTERPRYEFCYLTQLSYLGLTSYLGTVSWHTLSEWRRERGLRAIKTATPHCVGSLDVEATAGSGAGDGASAAMTVATRPTTIERQHWFLTDMNFFLYHTICTFHVIVPIIYWGYLSVQGEARMMAIEVSADSLWRNYSFHGGDLILVLLEFSINAMPFIPSHILIVFFICLLYLAEAHLVHYVDGFWIYPFLDTSGGPIWVAMYFGVGVAIACAFAFMYFLHRMRNWVINRRAMAAAAADASPKVVVIPEMVTVTSSALVNVQVVYPGRQSTFPTTTLPTDTVFISTHYDLSNPAHPHTSHALFPTTAPVSQPMRQPLPIPTQILIQSRRRSYSNCSNDSTTSTLVGSDEGMMCKKQGLDSSNCTDTERPISERTARRLSMSLPQPQVDGGNALEKVDEEDDHETESTGGDR